MLKTSTDAIDISTTRKRKFEQLVNFSPKYRRDIQAFFNVIVINAAQCGSQGFFEFFEMFKTLEHDDGVRKAAINVGGALLNLMSRFGGKCCAE